MSYQVVFGSVYIFCKNYVFAMDIIGRKLKINKKVYFMACKSGL